MVQRVSRAAVRVDEEVVGQIGPGLLVLLGAGSGDDQDDVRWLADKILQLRIFPDDAGLMNRSLVEIGGSVLVVSQFTLYGDCRKGRRPSFAQALAPEPAEALYLHFIDHARQANVPVATGRFGAMMAVDLTNDGPVTLLLDSRKQF